MVLLRWILALAILLLQKYTTATSIAQEINFEVTNMRESTKNDQQVYQEHNPMETELEETKDEAENIETLQSEIVETHILPGEHEPEELNTQPKRPRRRRRRRRRKRPKPTLAPDELDSYYTIPEEEINQKPIKYRQEETEEPVSESSTTARRRNIKRRRRPLKRPLIIEDYPTTAEGSVENINNTDENLPLEQLRIEQIQEKSKSKKPETLNLPNINLQPIKLPLPATVRKIQIKKETESSPTLMKETSKIHSIKENEFLKPLEHSEVPKHHEIMKQDKPEENEYSKPNLMEQKIKSKNISNTESHKEIDALKEDLGVNNRRQKRPSLRGEEEEHLKLEFEPNVVESIDPKNQVHITRKNEMKLEDDVKINLVEQRKLKIDERVKQNDTNKKDVFKLRRLPPISAILRHAKSKPKNETVSKPGFKNDTSKIKESVSNEILTHVATLDQLNQQMNETNNEEIELLSTSTIHSRRIEYTTKVDKVEKKEPTITPNMSKSSDKANHFEFPIITYTEQKQRSITTTSIPSTSSTASTTENTAFVYIPCNHTIAEKLKNASSSNKHNINEFSELENTTESIIVNETIITTKNQENVNVFDTSAIKRLEKLWQGELETINPPIDIRNQTKPQNMTHVNTLLQHLDASVLESELNYLFQRSTTITTIQNEMKSSTEPIFREPKWYQDSLKYRQIQPNDGQAIIPEKGSKHYNKEIIISYTSTTPPTNFNEIDPQELFHGNELTLHLRNNSYRRLSPENIIHKNKNHTERKKLPLAVKSAIIISGAILALAVLGFFALLLSCKIRQAKSRMKCHRELYRERFQNSEFRQSSRSTSPVVSKSNYNTRNFPNNIQTNVASNRNYYLWQTLRKTFQYD